MIIRKNAEESPIRDSCLLRDFLEIVDGDNIETNRDLSFRRGAYGFSVALEKTYCFT